MSLRDRAKEALERAGAATVGRAEDGVWEIEREELDAEDFTKSEQALAFPQSVGPIASWEPGNLYDSRQHEADAVFIANARADVPDFAGAVLRLTGEEMSGRAVIAEQHPPEEHTTWRDPEGVEIFADPTGEEKKGWDRFLAAHPRTRSEPVLFAADPSVVPGAQQFVEGYHIDTQDGLNLFADTIRRM